jgi:hypothetical protein
MAAPAFVTALDLPSCKGVLDAGHYKYSCGLEMADASIKGKDSGAVGKATSFRAAHTVHHGATNRWDGQGHDSTATLYFTPTDAWCSCGYVY